MEKEIWDMESHHREYFFSLHVLGLLLSWLGCRLPYTPFKFLIIFRYNTNRATYIYLISESLRPSSRPGCGLSIPRETIDIYEYRLNDAR